MKIILKAINIQNQPLRELSLISARSIQKRWKLSGACKRRFNDTWCIQKIIAAGTINIKDGNISAIHLFKVLLKDYNIKVPTIVTNKIAKEIEINC